MIDNSDHKKQRIFYYGKYAKLVEKNAYLFIHPDQIADIRPLP